MNTDPRKLDFSFLSLLLLFLLVTGHVICKQKSICDRKKSLVLYYTSSKASLCSLQVEPHFWVQE